MTPRPSPEQLHELLYFDADGELCWRERPPPTVPLRAVSKPKFAPSRIA
jgi:hypothetical protein